MCSMSFKIQQQKPHSEVVRTAYDTFNTENILTSIYVDILIWRHNDITVTVCVNKASQHNKTEMAKGGTSQVSPLAMQSTNRNKLLLANFQRGKHFSGVEIFWF